MKVAIIDAYQRLYIGFIRPSGGGFIEGPAAAAQQMHIAVLSAPPGAASLKEPNNVSQLLHQRFYPPLRGRLH